MNQEPTQPSHPKGILDVRTELQIRPKLCPLLWQFDGENMGVLLRHILQIITHGTILGTIIRIFSGYVQTDSYSV